MSSSRNGSGRPGSAPRPPADAPVTKTRLRRGEIHRKKRPAGLSGSEAGLPSDLAGDAEELIYDLVEEDLADETTRTSRTGQPGE